MATISHPIVTPYVFKTGSVTFKLDGATDVDDFTKHISELTLTPSTQSGTWTGISGNVIADQGLATWAAQFGLAQDLDDESLLWFLFDNEGSKAQVVFIPATGAATLTFDVVLSAANIGGAVGPNPLGATVTMAVSGKPVRS